MDVRDTIRGRLSVSNLEARRDWIEARRVALLKEAMSPLTGQDRREQAFRERSELMGQLVKIARQLEIPDGSETND